MFKWWFSSSQIHTLLGGYLGSLLFVLFLTAVGNLETCLFGKSFQVKLFPEGKYDDILLTFLLGIFLNYQMFQYCFAFWLPCLHLQQYIGYVEHLGKCYLYILYISLKVFFFSVLLSLVALYYINQRSQKVYAVQAVPTVTQTGKKKRA